MFHVFNRREHPLDNDSTHDSCQRISAAPSPDIRLYFIPYYSRKGQNTKLFQIRPHNWDSEIANSHRYSCQICSRICRSRCLSRCPTIRAAAALTTIPARPSPKKITPLLPVVKKSIKRTSVHNCFPSGQSSLYPTLRNPENQLTVLLNHLMDLFNCNSMVTVWA